jgi:hypothetical protein
VLNSIPCQLISGADLWSRAEVMLAIAAAQLVTTRGSHLPAVLRLVEKLPVCKGLSEWQGRSSLRVCAQMQPMQAAEKPASWRTCCCGSCSKVAMSCCTGQLQ